MDITYYNFHEDEYRSIKEFVKNEMQRIWGDLLDRSNESLEDDKVFLNYFEEYQPLITGDALADDLKKASINVQMNKEKVAAFIYKVRNGKYPFEVKKSSAKKWLECYSDPTNELASLVWIDVESIDEISISTTWSEKSVINISTAKGKLFRASKYSIPDLLIENALLELIAVISKK
ncbi:hypothetical protein ACTHEV_005163 [Klebsiella pneumoniae]|uniref:hypothetical protein n=1 Tax=Klebsiella pneumoniae TaxID=573 RepID=UPI00109128A3|nr:hypothetical protein [Klebsiella pneumoniae]VGB99593.1 Uncharacterised protein [Klebsiella pneumoniae]